MLLWKRCSWQKMVLAGLASLWLGSAGAAAGAGETPPSFQPDPELIRLPMTAMLFNLPAKLSGKEALGAQFVKRVADLGLQGTEAGRINVEIVNRNGDIPVDQGIVRSHDGRIDAVWRGQTSAWIPPVEAAALAADLPPGYFLRQASLAHDNDQGPATVGSDSYIDPGPGGQGMIAGIIDRNFVMLSAAEDSGFVPVATRHDYGSGGFESGSIQHGTAHLETVYDHASLAEYHLFRIGNSTHLGTAVDDAIDLGVNVLSATQSFYNEGWDDDTGAAAQAAAHAANSGILYVSSSGNRGKDHWQGMFSDNNGNSWHEWSGATESNSFGAVDTTNAVNVFLQWDENSGAVDYDLFLVDPNGNILDSSTSGPSIYEEVYWKNQTGAPVTVRVWVQYISGPLVEFEIFDIQNNNDLNFQVPEGSLTSPNNNSAANCLTIGAVPYSNYADGQLYNFSSRGPTNSGARGLDLIGPTDTNTFAYGGAYGGTSCATPNVAGAALALWATLPEFGADGIRILLTDMALGYNDWGALGPDPQYGYGGIRFPRFWDATQWVDQAAENPFADPSRPLYYLDDALAAGAVGDRILFIGGDYPGPRLLDQPRLLENVGDSAIIGGN